MKTIVMGGYGQVGSAIVNILSDAGNEVDILDTGRKDSLPTMETCDFLHVCIPWGPKFIQAVKAAAKKYSAKWVIVHATVPVGTCRRIDRNVAHSPVRGQHDKLESSMRRFTKYVAGVTPSATEAATTHLVSAGITVEMWDKPEETELMKLLCLSRYLNDLAFYEIAAGICKRFKVPPGRLPQWTGTYNDGYLGTAYGRPMLKFPNGVAGGHCVMPVSKILYEQTKNKWLLRNIATFKPKTCKKK